MHRQNIFSISILLLSLKNTMLFDKLSKLFRQVEIKRIFRQVIFNNRVVM